jgi:hypothetical protein
MDLTRLRQQVEALTREIERRRYRVAVGLDATPHLDSLFSDFPGVATQDAVALVREARQGAEGRRALRLQRLECHLLALVAESSAVEASEQLAQRLTERLLGPAGESWPLPVALALGPRDPDRDGRAATEAAAIESLAETERLVSEIWDRWRAAHQGAGLSVAAAWGLAHDADPSVLAAEAESFLRETDAMYEDVLAWRLGRSTGLGPFPHGAERHDLIHALALTDYDGLFPARRDTRRVLETLERTGLSLGADGQLRIDAEDRESKSPEPTVALLDPPHRVVAAYRPDGGYIAVRDALRAWGEGVHDANVDADRPFEDRFLGDRSLPAATGLLFQHVLLDRHWMRRTFDVAPPDLIRVMALDELRRLRHAAAVWLRSLQLDRGDSSASQAESHVESASAASGALWPASLCLFECSPHLQAGTTLRAASFEAALVPEIQERFNEDWWANPHLGPFLLKLFARGQFDSTRAWANELHLAEPKLAPLVARFQDLLG